jgi:undecaprenyl-diphosphatase
MTLLQSIILGIVQGATEFLPISSSGHVVLVPHLFGWNIPVQDAFIFNIMVQAATLIAVFSYFWQDISNIISSSWHALVKKQLFSDLDARLGLFIILATIPAGIVGITLNNFFEQIFANPLFAAIFLLGTAILLIIAERAGKRDRTLDDINWKDVLWIGAFQILALLPGISRSGATITGGMLKDFDRPAAARFSFLISIPLMMAAGAKATYEFIALPNTAAAVPIYLAGCIAAAIVGYLSIKWLMRFLNERSLYWFAGYCVVFATINLLNILI